MEINLKYLAIVFAGIIAVVIIAVLDIFAVLGFIIGFALAYFFHNKVKTIEQKITKFFGVKTEEEKIETLRKKLAEMEAKKQ